MTLLIPYNIIYVIQKKSLNLNIKTGKVQSALQFTYFLHLDILNLRSIVGKFPEALKLSALVILVLIIRIVTILTTVPVTVILCKATGFIDGYSGYCITVVGASCINGYSSYCMTVVGASFVNGYNGCCISGVVQMFLPLQKYVCQVAILSCRKVKWHNVCIKICQNPSSNDWTDFGKY
jgi:hypothetical protein